MRINALTLSLAFVIAAVVETSVAGLGASAAAFQKPAKVPSFDISSICSRVTKDVETPDGCVAGEQGARDQLNKVWTQ